ncbi:MAG: zinc transporter [Eubacteriaceae bacterium]|nr:zinc transporter [Eubacteriaceae bacterium]
MRKEKAKETYTMFLYHHDVNGGHTHDHDHEHEHEHEHADLSGLSESEKAMKTLELLLDHWVEHNVSHMEGFEEWAEKAIANDKPEVADAIYEAIHYMQHANEELAKAKSLM